MESGNLEKTIHKLYDKLTYFDMYGTSILFFIIITIFVFLVHSYCIIMQTSSEIKDDWINQRCKPQVIPFAGYINKPDDKTAFEYTGDNFNFCIQNILTNITGYFVQPFNYLISALTKIFDEIKDAINKIRELMDYFRVKTKEVAEEILSRTLNILVPIQKMFISLIDSLGKTQGVMTAGLYTLLGTYYTLQSLLGAIVEFIVDILLILVVLIVGLWILPFTYPMAMTMTVIFLAISIPLAIITIFMTEVLHVQTNAIPQLRCFDKNTLMEMNDGSFKRIELIQVGEILKNNNMVTAKMKVDSCNLNMVILNDVIISETHYVFYDNKWILTKDHPDAIPMNMYKEPYLYCLNTSSKTIIINNIVFSDWDEIFDEKLDLVLNYNIYSHTNKSNNKNKETKEIIQIGKKEHIHKYLDKGFPEDTSIKMKSKLLKKIQDVSISDTLEDGSIVYGIVEIETEYLSKRNEYNLVVNGNTNTNNSNNIDKIKNKKLFHLLTNTSKVKVNEKIYNDYNSIIDFILIK